MNRDKQLTRAGAKAKFRNGSLQRQVGRLRLQVEQLQLQLAHVHAQVGDLERKCEEEFTHGASTASHTITHAASCKCPDCKNGHGEDCQCQTIETFRQLFESAVFWAKKLNEVD